MTAEALARAPAPNLFQQVRKAYFGSVTNGAVTVLCLSLLLWIAWNALGWAFFSATWSLDGGAAACEEVSGACWSVIRARWRLILFGLYPYEAQWRSGIACISVVVMIVLSCIPSFWTVRRISAVWALGFGTFYILMRGGIFGLAEITEDQWGGLSLTIFIFIATTILGMPMALMLALMRRSELYWISKTTGLFIDIVRSLPLLSILFACAMILPFLLPGWFQPGKLYRVIFGSALFFAAYQAEIIRGGLQGVPRGQDEAAKALGLGYWRRIGLIQMPQAFRNALPATINQIVITFKETSLVIVIGFFEILASGNAAFGTGEWTFAFVEVYVFVAFIYFVFVFSLSRYGAYLERRLDVGHH